MIETRSVSKQLGGKQVLADVSLTAEDGHVTGFVGPNGAGKTTLMKIVACLIPADSGAAAVNGRPFSDALVPARTLGVYLSGEWLPARRSGEDHLRFVCETQGFPTTRVRPMLETVGLWGAHRREIRTYSLGMRQRLGIAAALIGDPANIMLDEPVNGLDPQRSDLAPRAAERAGRLREGGSAVLPPDGGAGDGGRSNRHAARGEGRPRRDTGRTGQPHGGA